MDELLLCKSCRFVKTSDHFYSSNRTRCKECVKASVRNNRSEKIDYYRAYDRARGDRPDRVAARKKYQRTDQGRAAHQRALLAHSTKEPKKHRARIALGNAIRDGRVIPQPCWVCGDKAEAHHPDYDRPLDVVWLCNTHHRAAHDITKEHSSEMAVLP